MSHKSKHKPATPLTKLTKLPTATIAFVKEAKEELKKVTWPDRQTTIRYTLIVIVSSLVISLIIGGIDYLFEIGLQAII